MGICLSASLRVAGSSFLWPLKDDSRVEVDLKILKFSLAKENLSHKLVVAKVIHLCGDSTQYISGN